jgi:hypothetical protein
MTPPVTPSDKSGASGSSSKTSLDQFYKDAKRVLFSGDPADLRYYIEELKLLRDAYSALISQGELTEKRIFLTTLAGEARAWFLDYQRSWTSWYDCLQELREAYGFPRDVLKVQLGSLQFKLGDNVQEFCKKYVSLVEELGYETSGQRAVEDFIGQLQDIHLRLQMASQAKSLKTLFDAARVLKQLVSISMGTVNGSSQAASVQAAPESTPVSKYGSSAPPTTSAAPSKADEHSDVNVLAQKFDKLTLVMQEHQRQLINILRDNNRQSGPPPWQRNRDGPGPSQQPSSSNQHTQSNNDSRSEGSVRLIRSPAAMERELPRHERHPSAMRVCKFDYCPEEEPVSPVASQPAGGLSMAALQQPVDGPFGKLQQQVSFGNPADTVMGQRNTSVMAARQPALRPAGDGDAAMLPRPAQPPSGAQVAEAITNRYLFGTRLNITFGELYKVAAPRYRAMMTTGFNLLHQETEQEQRQLGNQAGLALKVGGRVALAQSHPCIFECDTTNSVGTVPADAHGLLELEATIDGHPGNVMVDTGSTYNVIEEKWARSLGIMSSLGSPKVYSGVDGVKHYSLGTCTLMVAIGKGAHRVQCPSEFIVIPDNSSPRAPLMVLVGLPFLRALSATVDVPQHQLHVMRDGCTRYSFNFLPDTSVDSMVAAVKPPPPPPPLAQASDSSEPAAGSKETTLPALSRIKDEVQHQLAATSPQQLTSGMHAGLLMALPQPSESSVSDSNSCNSSSAVREQQSSNSSTGKPLPPTNTRNSDIRPAAPVPAAAPLGGTPSDQIASPAGISVAWLPMSAEPPDASDGIPKLSGCEDRDCSAGLGSPAPDSSSLSKTGDTAPASADAFEQALRDNPFVFAMQQESLRDAVRRVLSVYSGPPPPGQYEPRLFDEEMELVKEMVAMTSKQPVMEACALGAPIYWSQGDATAVG